MPRAEEELGEVEQMACFLFLLWARQMSNGSNYISARGGPSKTFAIYGHHRAAAGASRQYLLGSSHGNQSRPGPHVAWERKCEDGNG